MSYRWTMTGARKPLVREDTPIPEPAAREAVVEVVGCGVCHTDLAFLFDGVRPRHPLPIALGHEIAGTVVAAGDWAQDWIGRDVVVPAVMPCGTCTACAAGRGTICSRQKMPGNDIHGGFASHVRVPADGLCEVPHPGPDGHIGQSGCTLAQLAVMADAVTTPYQAICRSGLARNDVAVIVGLGGVGGFCLQICAARGAHVVGIDCDPERLEAHAGGRSLLLDSTGLAPKEVRSRVHDYAEEMGASQREWKIFECSGTPGGQATAWGSLVHGSYLSVIGFSLAKMEVRLAHLMALDATAEGNWGCLPELYPEVLDLILEGVIKIPPFVELHPMSDIQAVIEDLHRGRLRRRPVLTPVPEGAA